MNKNTLLLTAALLTFPVLASAQENNGGFIDINTVTVEQAKGLPDDAYVTIQGNIIQKTGDEEYVLQDAAGNTIAVEIDDDDWDGVDVSPNDLVEIQGQIDKGWTTVEIDVDTVSKVAPQMKSQSFGTAQ